MSANRVCWSREAIDFATQVDVGGLEVDDPRSDALFRAIHQSLPVRRERNGQFTEVSENDVLRAFTRPITSNEPLLLFVKGEKGTGKSHLVRWLKSRLGARPRWHVVYIEKRNTSLRRVTERILAGINTPKAEALRQELARASSEIASDEEAMAALLARLDQLVTFDPATEIPDLQDLSPAELDVLRSKAHRLLGDYTFRNELSKPDGPVHRIVRLARGGAKPSEDVDEAELHLTESRLQCRRERFRGPRARTPRTGEIPVQPGLAGRHRRPLRLVPESRQGGGIHGTAHRPARSLRGGTGRNRRPRIRNYAC